MSAVSVDDLSEFFKQNSFSVWVALHHHVTHKRSPLTLVDHSYLYAVLSDPSDRRVIMKSTQGGVSEALIILAWSAAFQGNTVFYVLPTDGLKNRFVSNRWDKSIRFSEFYRKFSYTKDTSPGDKIDNKSLKDIGKGVISFAGSKSDVPFVELPADWLIVDEADKCDSNRLEMAYERLGHSKEPHEIYVGNPTYKGSFLHTKFNESTKSKWFIKHSCGNWVHPDFFNTVIQQVDTNSYVIRDKDFEFGQGKDIRPICPHCHEPIDRFQFGEFVPEQESSLSGKHINRVFSGASPLVKMVDAFSKSLGNDYKLQRFYNSELGLPYDAEGSKVSSKQIMDSSKDYLMEDSSEGPCVMGIDVGTLFHVRINRVLPDRRRQAVFIGTVTELSDLFALVNRYHVVSAVIDALPELRLSRNFSYSSPGHFRCFFGGDKGDSFNLKEKTVSVSRTAYLDEVKEEIILSSIVFPKNIQTYEDYMNQMQEPVRIWNEEREKFEWVSSGADHFFFAELYAHVAYKFLKFSGV